MIGYADKIKTLFGLRLTPTKPLEVIWRNRRLIKQLAKQEIHARYKGSLLGIGWSLITPFASLLVFTFVFTTVFQGRWNAAYTSTEEYALLLLVGLLVFNMLSETINRAPGLLLENVSYLKKVVFPVEILSIVSVLVSLVTFFIGFGAFLLFHLILRGVPPWQLVFVPIIMAPYVLLLIGVSWFLSATGVFLRDLRHVVGPATTLLMFLTPVFYPVSALPISIQRFLFLNPATTIIEQSRAVAVEGTWPSSLTLAGYAVAAWVIAWAGFVWFGATRRGFADVV